MLVVYLVACGCVGIATKSFFGFLGMFLFGIVLSSDSDTRMFKILTAIKSK